MSDLLFHQSAMTNFTFVREETEAVIYMLTFFLAVGFMLTMRLSCCRNIFYRNISRHS